MTFPTDAMKMTMTATATTTKRKRMKTRTRTRWSRRDGLQPLKIAIVNLISECT